jgi:hypothetical protein
LLIDRSIHLNKIWADFPFLRIDSPSRQRSRQRPWPTEEPSRRSKHKWAAMSHPLRQIGVEFYDAFRARTVLLAIDSKKCFPPFIGILTESCRNLPYVLESHCMMRHVFALAKCKHINKLYTKLHVLACKCLSNAVEKTDSYCD